MTNNSEDQRWEDNASRLIQAGLGGSARPDPLAKERTWERLKRQVHAKPSAAAFPDRTLVFLAGVFALMTVWLIIQVFVSGVTANTSKPFIAIALILTLNLAMVPVASIFIVRRRRHA